MRLPSMLEIKHELSMELARELKDAPGLADNFLGVQKYTKKDENQYAKKSNK